jgi:3-hydroxy acid dehydrogenase/malonic semialdehyde reductase
MIETNVKGLLYNSRKIIPGMVERKSGDIINIGSIAGHEVYPGGAVYCASKHAVDALTRGLRMDLVGTPLRVCTVDPGLVETEFPKVRFKGDDERAAAVYDNLEALQAKDIAEVAYFMLSRPDHVNISDVIVLAKAQASATVVKRN